jgi:hypothetical protein
MNDTKQPEINPEMLTPPATEAKSPHHEIFDHKLNGLNDAISILVQDDPGPGGAHHKYGLYLHEKPEWPYSKGLVIEFQNGPILEAGFNGFTNEALLAVLIDRMRGFQSGPFACRENAMALTKMEESLMWLQYRTRARLARGVEGTHKA